MTDNKTSIDQKAAAAADSPSSPVPKTSRINAVIAGLIVVAAAGAIGWWALRPHHDLQAQQSGKPEPATPGPASTQSTPTPPPAPPATTDAPRPLQTAQVTPPAAAPAPAPTPAPPPAPERKPEASTPPTTPAPPPPPESKPEASTPPATPAPASGPPLTPRKGPITEETLDLVKRRAAAGETDAMEELARRYLDGVGVKVNPAEGAQWLQRAAERGSLGSIYNVAVMYERGIVLKQDQAKAVEWYTKAAAAGVPMAMHNLALIYREGVGVPADEKRAYDLLLTAARNGMSASMFALGTMYEAGSFGLEQDYVQAVVWYAMALQFQRASPATQNSNLAQRAEEKVTGLQLTLPPNELQRAQTMGETEFRLIVDTIKSGPKAPPASALTPPTAPTQTGDASAPRAPSSTPAPATAPADPKEQLTEIQRLLSALGLYNGKADGAIGPATRAAIKTFQRSAGMPETGEPSQPLAEALREKVEAAKKK